MTTQQSSCVISSSTDPAAKDPEAVVEGNCFLAEVEEREREKWRESEREKLERNNN